MDVAVVRKAKGERWKDMFEFDKTSFIAKVQEKKQTTINLCEVKRSKAIEEIDEEVPLWRRPQSDFFIYLNDLRKMQ